MSVTKKNETRAGQSEYAPYITGLLARERERRRRMQLRCAGLKRWKLPARRPHYYDNSSVWYESVRVFGSVLRPHRFHERSDIDLVVEGLPTGAYLKAWALLNGPGVEFEIDLVTSDECRSAIWDSAMREGVDV